MLTYRREIDGLRAIAVIAVIFFHADLDVLGFHLFAGGYVGVDVFFVISGYLITSIILKEKEAGTFTFSDFYERRVRRILPALFFMMLCCLPLSFIWMTPEQLDFFSSSLIAVPLFVSNVLFFLEDDYFGIASELKPLLHTWSLGVEEQYYLIFPLFLILFFALGKRKLFIIVAVIALLSFALAQLGGNLSSRPPFYEENWSWLNVGGWAFFLTPGRVWELMLGVLTALYLFHKPAPSGFLNQYASLLGLCLILYAVFFYGVGTPAPSSYTLLPTLGALLIIIFANPATAVGMVLSKPSFVGIGLISYSAYLWHQPLFAFARLRSNQEPCVLVFVLLSFASLFIGYLSYRYVEKPFRNRKKLSRLQLFSLAIVISLVFVGVGYIGKQTRGFYDLKYSWVKNEQKHLIIDKQKLIDERKHFWTNNLKEEMSAGFTNDSKIKVLIIGDSHSEDLAAAFILNNKLLGEKYQFRRLPFDETCMKQLFKVEEMRRLCWQYTNKLTKSGNIESADIILASTRWTIETIDYISNLPKWLGKNADKLVIVGRTAEFYEDVTVLALKIAKMEKTLNKHEINEFFAENFDIDVDTLNKKIKGIAKQLNVPYLDRVQLSCNDNITACESFNKDNKSYYSDYGHWTQEGSIYFGQNIIDANWLSILSH